MSCDATDLLCAKSIMADVKYAGEMGVMSGREQGQQKQPVSVYCSSLTTEYHTFHMQLVAFPPCQ